MDPEFLAIARKLRHEIEDLDGLDREITKKELLANFDRILSEPEGLSDLGRATFQKNLEAKKKRR
jgi:hypothetical protein